MVGIDYSRVFRAETQNPGAYGAMPVSVSIKYFIGKNSRAQNRTRS